MPYSPNSLVSIKAFITRDDFVNNTVNTVNPIFEISDISLTYSTKKQQYYSTDNSLYSLYLFNIIEGTNLTQTEVNNIIKVVNEFSIFLGNTSHTNKSQIILAFTNNFNTVNSFTPISNFNYNEIIVVNSVKAPDYITFTISDVNCSIWLSDGTFRLFYPDYEVKIVTPFDNFESIVNNASDMITALDNFNLLDFNRRIEENKNNNPTTYTRILNIPYRIPNSTITKNCYFGFNIYGSQGNYEFILKLELYNYLVNTLNIPSATAESIFPGILNINEFFIIPKWNRYAIPTQVGQNGINTQITLAYNETYDITNFVRVYNNITNIDNYLKANTYNVPFDYNNILLNVINGYYTETAKKDFKQNFSDLITVSSSHPDFARMSTKTQNLVTLLMTMLTVADSDNSTEMLNKILSNTAIDDLRVITRNNVEYLSSVFDYYQIYVIPKYEYLRIVSTL